MDAFARPPLREMVSRRRWPVACSAASVLAGCALWFAWVPLVVHRSAWLTPGDLWSTFRSAHYVGWGDFGGVYAAGTGLVSFPGLLLVLAPVAMLTGALGLSEDFPFSLPHPTAWFVLGPYEVLVGCVALFACDALAERLGVGRRRRALLCGAQAVALFNVTALWGHPEDSLAIGLALYCLVFVLDRRLAGAGWFFGLAVATQPVVLLMGPVLLALVGRRRALGFVVRAGLPTTVLLAVPLLSNFRATVHAIVDQPNFPRVDHATPWTALAPRLGGHGMGLAVAGGPGRVLAVLLACALGVFGRRWRARPDLLVWCCALALAARCFTESVMVPYYVWPGVAVALVAAAASPGAGRLVAAAVLTLGVTAFSDLHLSLWAWWLPVTGAIVAVLGVSVPIYTRGRGRPKAADQPMFTTAPAGSLVGAVS